MRIVHHVSLLVLICLLGGLGLGLGLTREYQHLDRRSRETSMISGVLRDVTHLDENLEQWLLMSDLAFDSGEMHLIDGIREQSSLISTLISEIRSSRLTTVYEAELTLLAQLVNRNEERIARALAVDDADRQERLNGLQTELEKESVMILGSLETLKRSMAENGRDEQTEIRTLRDRLQRLAWGCTLAYFAIVVLLWHWTMRTLVMPLQDLNDAARDAMARDDPLSVVPCGPVEVRELTNTIASFVSQLEARVQTRTADLHRVNDELMGAKVAAEAADRAKSDFLANMSHEIRTPMTAVLGYAELIDREELDDEQRRTHIATIRRNGEHLLCLINEILDLSKLEAGCLAAEQVDCSIWELLLEVQELLRVSAAAKDLVLDLAGPAAVPESIRTDPQRLKQILVNIIGNAIKFTAEGGVLIRFDTIEDPTDPDGDRIEIRIVDSGIGIEPDSVGPLFEPFTQADETTTRRFGGTGLGLTISRHLARLLGGDITVESTPRVGSTFVITVGSGPLNAIRRVCPSDVETAWSTRRFDTSEDAVASRSGRVLMAEDGVDNQRLVSFFVEKAGHEIVVVEDGRAAVDAALEAWRSGNPFDVILMDMQMPILDGYGATRALRQGGYDGPIIALTAHAMRTDRERCLAAGCNEFASKPIDRRRLVALIAHALQGTLPRWSLACEAA